MKISKKRLAKNLQDFFLSNKIKALSMKLYSADSDIDLVVIDKKQYHQAVGLLKEKGWQKNNNLSKIRERDKDFFSNQQYQFLSHLHQAFSWNTIPYLDSKTVWRRKIIREGLLFPSPEDELLIIAAHSLFENKYFVLEEMRYAQKLLKNKLNLPYLKKQALKFNWEKGLAIVLEKIAKNQASFSPAELLKTTVNKFLKDLPKLNLRLTFQEILNYFCIDWLWNYKNALKKQPKRPKIITFSGVDGSGKSTQAQTLNKFLRSKGFKSKVVHPGSAPIISGPSEIKRKGSLTVYLTLIKDIGQIWLAYLRSGHDDFLIFDRYLYDTLVKISYKRQANVFSPFLLWFRKLVPAPIISFLLQVDHQTSFGRDKSHSLKYHYAKTALYHQLSTYFKMITIKTKRSKRRVFSEVSTYLRLEGVNNII